MRIIIGSFLIGCVFLLSSVGCQPKTEQPKSITKEEISQRDQVSFPKALGYVSDYTNLLSPQQKQVLEHKLKRYEQETTNELVVVILAEQPDIHEENFNQYALDLSRAWGVGKKYKDNGLSIVLSPSLRQIRISTGLATEKLISDQRCEEILQTIILPNFKANQFYQGLDLGIDALIKVWDDSLK